MRVRKIILIIFILSINTLLYSSDIDDEYLKIPSEDLNVKQYEESIKNIKIDLPKQLRELKDKNTIIRNSEFWMSYYNSLMYIEGYVLKKEAEVEKLKGKGRESQKKYERFLKETRLSD